MKYKLNTQEFAFLDMFWNGNLIELGGIFKYLCYSKLNLIWIQEKILYETQEFAVVYIFSKGNLIEWVAVFTLNLISFHFPSDNCGHPIADIKFMWRFMSGVSSGWEVESKSYLIKLSKELTQQKGGFWDWLVFRFNWPLVCEVSGWLSSGRICRWDSN